jgi:hypothetical protein
MLQDIYKHIQTRNVRYSSRLAASFFSIVIFCLLCLALNQPSLSSPVSATDVAVRPTFKWDAVTNALSYKIQVNTNEDFSTYTM